MLRHTAAAPLAATATPTELPATDKTSHAGKPDVQGLKAIKNPTRGRHGGLVELINLPVISYAFNPRLCGGDFLCSLFTSLKGWEAIFAVRAGIMRTTQKGESDSL